MRRLIFKFGSREAASLPAVLQSVSKVISVQIESNEPLAVCPLRLAGIVLINDALAIQERRNAGLPRAIGREKSSPREKGGGGVGGG